MTGVPAERVQAAWELALEARCGLDTWDAAAEALDRASLLLALGHVAGALADLATAIAALTGDVDRVDLIEQARAMLGSDG